MSLGRMTARDFDDQRRVEVRKLKTDARDKDSAESE
jgi:hypothetical protein